MSDLIVSIGQTKAMFSLDWLSRSSFLLFAPQVRLTPVKAVTFDFRVYFLMMMVLCWASCCCKVGLVRIWTLDSGRCSEQYSSVYFIISWITLHWPSVLYSAVQCSVVKLQDQPKFYIILNVRNQNEWKKELHLVYLLSPDACQGLVLVLSQT